MKILVDFGGSGARFRRLSQGQLREHTYPVKRQDIPSSDRETFEKWFFDKIYEMAQDGNPSAPSITGIAVSVPGECDYLTGEVRTCWHYPLLIGKLREKLQKRFGCQKVFFVNDGEAHALSLKYAYGRENRTLNLGAVNLAIGTSIGFGALDVNGQLVHTSEGRNWEIGEWTMETSAHVKKACYALGSDGLAEMERNRGTQPETYVIFGQRLCKFIAQAIVPKFHPRTIGLSGGIVAKYRDEIMAGINRESGFRNYQNGVLKGVEFFPSSDPFSATTGLKTLFDMP